MKMVISDPSNGKSYQVDVPKDSEGALIGKKIGESIDGGFVGATGYTFKITGGSDIAGFPMRADISGPKRMKALISSGPGIRKVLKGERRKKVVRGNLISDELVQINVMVSKAGPQELGELFAKKKEEKK